MEFKSNIPRTLRRLKDNEYRALEKVGRFVQGDAILRAPVDEGNLRASIDYRVNRGRKKVIIGAGAEYAVYVEYGTGKYAKNGDGRKTPWAYIDDKSGELIWTAGSKPQPYLGPAFEENKKRIQKIVAEQLGRRLK